VGDCLAEYPAFVGLKDEADLKAFFTELSEDQRLGAYSAHVSTAFFHLLAVELLT
jgi:hypothetical protein